jgi:diguanylate cyclase (GGDEF)-like protein
MNFYHSCKQITIFHSVLNIAFLVFFACILFSSQLTAMPIPKADAGMLNLTSWDFDKDGTVRLEGDWQFYWQKFIAPEQKPLTDGTFIEVPKSWDGHQLNDNRNAPAHGYASYQLSVSLPQNSPQLALKVIDIGEAFRLYVNGKLLHSGGETGTSQSMSKPAFASGVILLPENIGNEINIVIHVSNYNYPRGGLWDYITLGEISAIQSLNELALGYVIFLACSIGIIAIHHLSIYFQRRQDRTPLYLGLFCLAILLRIISTDDRFLLELMPAISFTMLIRLEYISFLLAIPAFAGFITNLLPGDYPKWMHLISKWFGLIFSCFVMVTPVAIFSEFLPLFQIYLVACVFFASYVFIQNVKQNREVAKAFLFGFIILAAASINDVLVSVGLLSTPIYLVGPGMLFFILIQSYSLSRRFAKSFSQVEALSCELEDYAHTLESKVNLRTKELESANRQLSQLASIDGLTGIANRRAFDQILRHALAEHTHSGAELALILCDIDLFKAYNDTYGHLEGDDALRKVAQCISDMLPENVNTVARYGGEEFAILLPNSDLNFAVAIAQRINKAVQKLNIVHESSASNGQLTISCGVAAILPTKLTEPETLIAQADNALYASKAAGRNTTVAAS